MSRGEGGLGVAGEIERALAAGYDPQQNPEDIVFTADLIDDATLDRVKALQIPVNAGSIDMLSQLGEVSPGHRVWLRVNPDGHGHSQKPIPAVRTASMASGTATCRRRWK